MKKHKEKSNSRNIKDLSEEEFIELIQQSVKGNQIEVSGVVVNSSTSKLKDIEDTVNRLVDRHRDFLLLRKELKLKTGFQE